MRDHDLRRRDFETFYARQMRNNPTKAENLLWQTLRRKALGVRFRRQQPMGPFVVDFYCSRARLVVELDGELHANEETRRNDEERTRRLEQTDCRVIRFWNGEVLNDLDGVVARIRSALAERGVSSV
jgi:very-short-patch-repair endonuclease